MQIAHHPENDEHQHHRKEDIHSRAGGKKERALMRRLGVHRVRLDVRAIFPLDPHEPAERDRVDRPDHAITCPAEEAGRNADAEFLDLDAARARGEEVTEFMYENQDREDGDNPESIRERV